MSGKVIKFPCAENSTDEIVQTINDLHEKGIKGIAFAAMSDDGHVYLQWTQTGEKFNYFELAGMVDTLKGDIYAKSVGLI